MLFFATRAPRATRRRLSCLGSASLRGRVEPLEERALLTAGIALDPTSGNGGLVTTDVVGRSSDRATNVAITEPDGKILVAGNTQQPVSGDHFSVARYNADGSLDTSFGNGGFVATTFAGYNSQAFGMAVDSSGRIVVVGNADASAPDIALARYNPDGSVDNSFGSAGLVTTRFENSFAQAFGVAIDSAGRVDIVGEVYHNTQTSGYQLLLARYNTDGSLDTTFGNGGSTFTSLGIYDTAGNALTFDTQGNIVVAGSYGASGNSQALVARFTSAGTLDTTFNGTGTELFSFGPTPAGYTNTAQANAVAIDSQHNIVVAGGALTGFETYITAARLTPTGTLDPTFGQNGVVETPAGGYGDMATGMAIDSSGNLVLSARGPTSAFAAYRYNSSGALDSSFGTAGMTIVNFGPVLTDDQANAVTLTSAGQIVLAGQAVDNRNIADFALARLNNDGKLDSSFGPNQNGTVLSSFALSTSNDARALAIQSDGKIVTAGSASASDMHAFTVSRYNEDGTLDTSFGNGGIVLTDVTGRSYPSVDNTANALAIDSQGRIVVAGTVDHLGGGTDIALVRYEPNGSLDTSFGNGGIVVTSLVLYGDNVANGVAIEANGDILVAGATSPAQTPSQSNFALLCYTSGGQLDSTFGGAALGGGPGWVQTDFGGGRDVANGLVIQLNGQIVLAGSANLAATGDDFALVRYNSDGSLDTSFGSGTGKVTTNFGPIATAATGDDAYGLTLDSQGRIVVAGASNANFGSYYGFAVARYSPDGTLDSSFGTGGKVLAAPGYNSYAGPVLVMPNGKILVGGGSDAFNQSRNFAIGRLNDNGTLDTTFTSSGFLETDFGGGINGWDQIYGMALDHEGRLVAAGPSFHPNTNYDVGVARYVLDSTLTANAGGPYSITEGNSLTLSAAASGGDGGPLTYSWDVNGDGTFGDAVGPSPTLTWAQLEALSPAINDGPATFQVSVLVSDSHSEYVVSAPVRLTLNDALPTVAVSGPASPEVVGQPQAFTLSASDQSSVDTAAGLSFFVNWGDGATTQTSAVSPATLTVPHVFTSSGSFTVDVWAIDKDGDKSPTPATFIAVVGAAAMQGGTLVVGGNNIVLQPANANGAISITVDGIAQGVFNPTSQIVVYGLAGGDTIQIKNARIGHHNVDITVPAVVFGGNGGDTIDARGSSANNVLVGGSGNDVLYGGSGRNLLIGAGGGDTLYGGGADDILIGGTTDYDSNLAALDAIMAEWGRTDISYQQRIADLDGAASGGQNGQYVLNVTTVHDDGAGDQLVGAGGQDWYVASAGDVVTGKKHNEIETII